jgi:hypothetical protein
MTSGSTRTGSGIFDYMFYDFGYRLCLRSCQSGVMVILQRFILQEINNDETFM